MKFNLADMNDPRIKNVCDEWDDEFEGVPFSAGVFVFVDAQHDVKFIGWAGDGKLRPLAEEAYNAGRGNGATLLGWARTFTSEKAESLAADWQKKYAPANNR